MTAEVAVLNRHAVALAADSAVTLRLREGPKVYHTNKLFSISKYEPVAVMLYGSADFLGVTWEMMIKAYRAQLGNRSFASVESYGADSLKFVEKSSTLFPARLQESSCYAWVRAWLRRLRRPLKNELEERLRGKTSLRESEIEEAFRVVFEIEESHLRRHKVLPSLKGLSSVFFSEKMPKRGGTGRN